MFTHYYLLIFAHPMLDRDLAGEIQQLDFQFKVIKDVGLVTEDTAAGKKAFKIITVENR